jgi:serine/threonine-protein kinase RsbW
MRPVRVLNERPRSLNLAAANNAIPPARKAAPSVTEQTTRLVLPSHIEAVADAAAAMTDFLRNCGVSEELSFGIEMAVRESVTNAMVHGNQEDESKSVEVIFNCHDNELEIEVRDQGEGFDPANVPDPTNAENLLKTSGRGIFLMRTFMDEIEWRNRPEGGTAVRMTKRF